MKITSVVIIVCLTISVLLGFWIYSTWHTPNAVQQQQSKKNIYFKEVELLQNEFATSSTSNKQQRQLTNAQLIENQQKQLNIAKSLAKLYRDGIPDKYDTLGKKIKGVAPIPEKAIHYFDLSYKLGSPYGLFKLAKVYHYGMHNLEPNWTNAIECYQKLASDPGVPDKLKKKAIEAVKELTKTTRDQKVHTWLNLPYQPPVKKGKYENKNNIPVVGPNTGIFTVPTARGINNQVGPGVFGNGFQIRNGNITGGGGSGPQRGGITGGGALNINAIFRATQDANNRRIGVQINNEGDNEGDNEDDDTTPEHQRNDLHNVHDSGVLGTIRRSIQNLQQATKIEIPIENSLRDIRSMLKNAGTKENDKFIDACKALDSIERSVLPLSSTNIREVDALHLVWNRIHDPINKDNKKALQENLVEELAECIEHDKPVCSTGRFTRILDTLNAVDPEVQIKPMYALKNEMMEKCALIRKQLYDPLPESEKQYIDSTKENESQMNFTSKLKDQIRDNLQKDYVQKQVLTQEQLDKEVNQWIDYI